MTFSEIPEGLLSFIDRPFPFTQIPRASLSRERTPSTTFIPVAAFYPILPSSAEHGVHLAGKEIGEHAGPHREGDRVKHISDFRGKARGRIGVYLQFDLNGLPFREE
jgi:hypothetical protein